jgi:signal transduction histidine kinase
MTNCGTLAVSAALSELNDQQAIEIRFEDTGEGISADKLEKIWEPFFTTKPEGKGTGLGMGICRRIVEDHGGRIAIESALGMGPPYEYYSQLSEQG